MGHAVCRITGESKEEFEEQLHRWKAALEMRGLKTNIGKTKILVTGKEGLTTLLPFCVLSVGNGNMDVAMG